MNLNNEINVIFCSNYLGNFVGVKRLYEYIQEQKPRIININYFFYFNNSRINGFFGMEDIVTNSDFIGVEDEKFETKNEWKIFSVEEREKRFFNRLNETYSPNNILIDKMPIKFFPNLPKTLLIPLSNSINIDNFDGLCGKIIVPKNKNLYFTSKPEKTQYLKMPMTKQNLPNIEKICKNNAFNVLSIKEDPKTGHYKF